MRISKPSGRHWAAVVYTAAALGMALSPGSGAAQVRPWVEGQIFDAADNREIADARIHLQGADGQLRVVYTDPDGHYRLPAVAPGAYALVVSRFGYETARFEIEILRPEPARLSIGLIAAPVQLAPVEFSEAGEDPDAVDRFSHDRPKSSSKIITREDIASRAPGVSSVLEIVRRIHPGWLVGRGNPSTRTRTEIMIYVNGVKRGGMDVLHTLPAQGVYEVWYVDALQATQRWGTGHAAGVIHVIMLATG